MTDAGRKSNWLQSNLAALGSAAVLIVYAAGYVRTKPAADRLAEESNRRRPPAPPPPVITVGHIDAPVPVASDSVVKHPARPAKKIEVKPPPMAKPDTTIAPPAAASAPASTPVNAPATPVTVPEPQPAAQPQPSAPDTASKAPAVLKDGLYSGWGTSRHGDIEAYVEIKAGKIVSAFISECLTQYSCDWIAKLPAQVIARQSPEVDFVSGATQSTNAFYYAVVAALKKAK